mmetsp:Transcript_35966/g.90607  ORF Transcript_35966/g.90607 Transcript_35966/m.90607 type:complete len:438 (+) Transcript_35966:174-1487(+)
MVSAAEPLLRMATVLATLAAAFGAYSCPLQDERNYVNPKTDPRSGGELNSPFCDYPGCNTRAIWGCGLWQDCVSDTVGSASPVCKSALKCYYHDSEADRQQYMPRPCPDPPSDFVPPASPAVVAAVQEELPYKTLRRTLYRDEDCSIPVVFDDTEDLNKVWRVQDECQDIAGYGNDQTQTASASGVTCDASGAEFFLHQGPSCTGRSFRYLLPYSSQIPMACEKTYESCTNTQYTGCWTLAECVADPDVPGGMLLRTTSNHFNDTCTDPHSYVTTLKVQDACQDIGWLSYANVKCTSDPKTASYDVFVDMAFNSAPGCGGSSSNSYKYTPGAPTFRTSGASVVGACQRFTWPSMYYIDGFYQKLTCVDATAPTTTPAPTPAALGGGFAPSSNAFINASRGSNGTSSLAPGAAPPRLWLATSCGLLLALAFGSLPALP